MNFHNDSHWMGELPIPAGTVGLCIQSFSLFRSFRSNAVNVLSLVVTYTTFWSSLMVAAFPGPKGELKSCIQSSWGSSRYVGFDGMKFGVSLGKGFGMTSVWALIYQVEAGKHC